uniref:Putative secreted protein n=1 Tax=Anopheles darlingi TaxID=43151 RepID=A0A2M4DMS5_ANODA
MCYIYTLFICKLLFAFYCVSKLIGKQKQYETTPVYSKLKINHATLATFLTISTNETKNPRYELNFHSLSR